MITIAVLRAMGDLDEDGGHARIVNDGACHYLGATLETRIQLCGRLAVLISGSRLEDRLPGRQGRLLFVYLAANSDTQPVYPIGGNLAK